MIDSHHPFKGRTLYGSKVLMQEFGTVKSVPDFNRCRSPARAKRRWAKRLPQHQWMKAEFTTIYIASTDTYIMHPKVFKEVKNAMQKQHEDNVERLVKEQLGHLSEDLVLKETSARGVATDLWGQPNVFARHFRKDMKA